MFDRFYFLNRCFLPVRFTSLLLTTMLVAACGGGGGESSDSDNTMSPQPTVGFSSTAVRTTQIDASSQCPAGGIQIHTGVDVDQNGTLEPIEVNNTQELCHLDTDAIMAEAETLSIGSVCPFGGHRLTIGFDSDNDRALTGEEISQTLLFCDRAVSTGVDLLVAVFSQGEEPEGENCPYGGHRQSVGIDENGNNILDPSEITSSQYYCDINRPIDEMTAHYYEYDYCSVVTCNGLEGAEYQYRYVLDVTDFLRIGRIVDDGIGEVSLELGSDAPSWLNAELVQSEYSDYYDSPSFRRYFDIVAYASDIPASAAGEEFTFTLTVTDGEGSLELHKQIKVIDSIGVSLDQTVIEISESGDDADRTALIKVSFDSPLPSSSIRRLGFSSSNKTAYLKAYAVGENDREENLKLSSSDYDFEWLSTDFFAGQTEAYLLLRVHDDLFPENSERIKLVVELPSRYDEELYFAEAALQLTVHDDGDQSITATVLFDQVEVTEGSAEGELTEVPFTISFSPAIPGNSQLQLRLQSDANNDGHSWGSHDAGFRCRSYLDYCDISYSIDVYEGMTEVRGTIFVKQDFNNERNEVFELTRSGTSNFVVEGLSASFTIVDDDEMPSIGFKTSGVSTYFETQVLNLEIEVDYTSHEPIVFNLTNDIADTAVEGVDYEFGVSMPITLDPGRKTFNLPVLINGNSFDTDSIEATISLAPVSGAVAGGASESFTLSIDKIQPYELSLSDLSLPLANNGSYSGGVDRDRVYIDEAKNIWLLGRIDEGNYILGETPRGGRDFFAAKYDMQGTLLWAKQFGTSGDDYSFGASHFNSKQGSFVSSRGINSFVVHADGRVIVLESHSSLSEFYVSAQGAKIDEQGAVYRLYSQNSSYVNSDVDGDGMATSILLLKNNADGTLAWVSEDFSSLQAHSDFRIYDLQLEVTALGTPFVLGNVYPSSIMGTEPIGNYDHIVASFSAESGTALSFERFGSDGYDGNSLITVPFGGDKILAFYDIDTGEEVAGELGRDFYHSVRVIINADGSIHSEMLTRQHSADARVRRAINTSDGKILLSEGGPYFSYSGPADMQLLDADLNELVATQSAATNYLDQTLILDDDGGYFVVDTNRHIRKMTPSLDLR